ncbi:MAG: copper-binding protein [Sterolibacterium sp.]|jgi:Cu/Ag efflux protein CusF
MNSALTASLVALATTLSTSALAADDHAGHAAMHGATHPAAPAAASLADGVVKKVDKSGGKITLAHGPLANLGMPAMTMVFRVKETAWLDQMKEGDKVRFLADNVNGSLTVVELDKAK